MLAATTHSAMTGAMSPFPLIEETTFRVPSAYLTAEEGLLLADHASKPVSVLIESEVRPSAGEQPFGRLVGAPDGGGLIIVSAHIDSKPGTPGAIDNAARVVVLLAVAELAVARRAEELRSGASPRRTVEFVPFNGEDHVLAPGEIAWLKVNPDLSDVALVVNVDAPGLPGAPSAYSLYGLDDEATRTVEKIAARYPGVAPGPQRPASGHMIFAMRGVPAIALTSTDFATASGVYSHAAADMPGILDYTLLEQAAYFAAVVAAAL